MKFIPKYITTDILAEYGEHLTHEAYNEMVKLNSTQGDYNTKILNQLFNTDEGIQIPYLDNKIKKVTDDQLTINEDMDQIVADMKALAGSLSKYTTICETRKMIQNATQGFVKTNKLKAGDNVDITVDALNNVTISARIEGGDVTKEYVDEQDASTLQESKTYTDNAIAQIDLDDYATKDYVDNAIADIPIPVVPTNVSAFTNDAGYITSHDIPPIVESDPYFSASPAAGIQATDITAWNNKSDFSGDYNDLTNKPTIPVVPTNVSAFNNDAGYITGYTEIDPVFSASPAAGITATDITNWDTPEVRIFNIAPNEVIDILGLKKGLYIVIGDMSVSNPCVQNLCYSPFRQDTSTSSISLTGGYFYVTQDITNNLPNESIVINYIEYGKIDYITNLKINNTAPSGIEIESVKLSSLNNSYVTINGTQIISGTKSFNSAISCNGVPTIAKHLARLSDIYNRLCSPYNTNNTYNTGDYVTHTDYVYICKSDNVTGSWDSSNWEDITSNINVLNRLKQYVDAHTEIHYVEDSDLTNQCFILKGKTKGIYLFTHAVGLLYDSTNTPSQTNPEVCRSGILWLNKDVDPNDTRGGVVGAMVSHAHIQNGETYVPSDCTMIITAPAMPSTMSGVVLSGGTGSPVNAVTPDVIAPNYSWRNTYNTGDLVTYDRKLYQCNSNNVTGSWNASYWTQKTLADLL